MNCSLWLTLPEHKVKIDLILNCSRTREISHTLNYISDAIKASAGIQTLIGRTTSERADVFKYSSWPIAMAIGTPSG